MSGPSLTVQRVSHGIVIRLSGEIDATNSAGLRDALVQARPHPEASVVLDMSAVTFLDSSGLRVLLNLQDQLARTGGSLQVVASQPQVLRLLQITGTSAVLHLRAGLAQALAAVEEHAARPVTRRPAPIGLVLPPEHWSADGDPGPAQP